MANAGKGTRRYVKPSSIKHVRGFDRAYRGRWYCVVKLYLLASSRIEKFEHAGRRIWEAMYRNQEGFEEHTENNLILRKLQQKRQAAVTLAFRQVSKEENKRVRDRYRALKGIGKLVRAINKFDALYFGDLLMDADHLGIEIFGSKKAAQLRTFCEMDPGGR
ncbi:hypothetical protein FALBO_5843 [Fusarium albosuccineum]|uniref:Uncharacterized protein n=1 Tax=Fusarium albosuccineum TaxID=1237068 RepID=A0A8H4P9F6_9HYPO|nr:hypothetical protein FALBO_5843 [Fusarium albosuccineum]